MQSRNNPTNWETCWESKTKDCGCTDSTISSLEPEEHAEEENSNLSAVAVDVRDSLIDWDSDTPWPEQHFPGSWGVHGIEETPWDDKERPYVRFMKYQELQLNDVENNGILTDRIIASCSSYLDRSPGTGRFVLCKVDLSKKLLTDITIMAYHHYLQYVDLSWNELSNVEPLGQLPFLMYLDVSHNFIERLLNFKPPFNLTYVNYSHNIVTSIGDLSKFWSIVHLNLSHNHIKIIEGVRQLKYLRHLDLSYNAIEHVRGLSDMSLLSLNLQHNRINDYEDGVGVGLKTLTQILHINLAHNKLCTLKLFEDLTNVQSIDVTNNLINDLTEITHLRHLNLLRELHLQGNPIATMEHYMEVCLSNVKCLSVLDGEILDAERKVAVKAAFENLPQFDVATNSSKVLFLQQINEPALGSLVVPVDQPSPSIIVLVGPPGSDKGALLAKFRSRHKRHTILGVSHTTRPKNDVEIENESYYFVTSTEFWELAKQGEFLSVSQTLGHAFGLAQAELEKTIEQSAVLILHMDLTGALTLRAKGYRCKLILAVPSTADVHRNKLIQKYYYERTISTHFGTTEIKNCPTKAKQFASESIKMSKTKTTIVDESTNAVIDDKDVDQFVNKTVADREMDKLFGTHASGILKVPSSKLTTKSLGDIQHRKTSVTFGKKVLISEQSFKSRAQSYRNVTFDPIKTSGKLSISVSAELVDDSEIGMLSVLSDCRMKIDDENEDVTTRHRRSEALNGFFDDVIESRNLYLDAHYSNPGLFLNVVFTDKQDEAINKLEDALKEAIIDRTNAPPIYQYPKDTVYHTIVATRLKSFHKSIANHMSTAHTQIKQNVQYTPKGRPFESLLNRPQKDIIESMYKKQRQAINYKLPEEMKYSK